MRKRRTYILSTNAWERLVMLLETCAELRSVDGTCFRCERLNCCLSLWDDILVSWEVEERIKEEIRDDKDGSNKTFRDLGTPNIETK